MPEYGILPADEGRGLLPWRWARERLEKARRYWLATTRPDARPHAVAVWGVWMGEAFYFSTGRRSRKARNLRGNRHCVVCTERADRAVIVEGVSKLVRDRRRLSRIAAKYLAKYRSGYPEDSNVYEVRPRVVFGFIEKEDQFCETATRWRF